MTIKRSGVIEASPEKIEKYLTVQERREDKELTEFSKKIKAEQEIERERALKRQKAKAIKLAKEMESKADCFVHFAPAYDGPFRAASRKRASWDYSVAPDYEGRENAMYELVCSYV